MTVEELSELVKSKSNPVVINKGIGTLPLLGVALIILKAMKVITWSWWWVLAPFWIPFCIAALVIIVAIIGVLVLAYKEVEKEEKEEIKKEVVEEKETPKKTTKKRKSKKDVEDGGVKGKNE